MLVRVNRALRGPIGSLRVQPSLGDGQPIAFKKGEDTGQPADEDAIGPLWDVVGNLQRKQSGVTVSSHDHRTGVVVMHPSESNAPETSSGMDIRMTTTPRLARLRYKYHLEVGRLGDVVSVGQPSTQIDLGGRVEEDPPVKHREGKSRTEYVGTQQMCDGKLAAASEGRSASEVHLMDYRIQDDMRWTLNDAHDM